MGENNYESTRIIPNTLRLDLMRQRMSILWYWNIVIDLITFAGDSNKDDDNDVGDADNIVATMICIKNNVMSYFIASLSRSIKYNSRASTLIFPCDDTTTYNLTEWWLCEVSLRSHTILDMSRVVMLSSVKPFISRYPDVFRPCVFG